MVGKTLFFNLIWRIALIIITSFGIIFVTVIMLDKERIFTIIIGSLLLIIQIFYLTRHVLHLNKTLISFIDTVGLTSATELSFREMNTDLSTLESRLNQIKLAAMQSRFEEQKQKSLLDIVLSTMDAGLICIKNEGEVVFSNRSACSMLNTREFYHQRELDAINPTLAAALKNARAGVSRIISLPQFKAIVRCNHFLLNRQNYSLYSIQNIQNEVDSQEIESWQKLIRVLTHEIMNSMSPIISLSKSLKNSTDLSEKMFTGLTTIENTGEGLIHFIEEYRKLSTLPLPDKTDFLLYETLSHIQSLFSEECRNFGIKLEIKIEDKKLELFADQHQVEQVLINLVKNAMESLKTSGSGIIKIKAFHSSGNTFVQVKDNGPGVPPAIHDQIFVPFYSTKINGNGIGLSLSRQIMNNHSGSIKFSSNLNEETMFTLCF